MKRIQAWALFILFLIVIGGGLYLWWRFDLRWRPHVITKNQPAIAKILDQAGWVSPSHGGAKLYVIVYGDCASCKRLEAEFPDLAQAGIDTRVVEVPTDGSPGASFQGKGTGGKSRLVIDQATETIVGATFTGFETADFLQAATLAIVAEVPLARLRHALAPYPTRSEVWLKLLEKWESGS